MGTEDFHHLHKAAEGAHNDWGSALKERKLDYSLYFPEVEEPFSCF